MSSVNEDTNAYTTQLLKRWEYQHPQTANPILIQVRSVALTIISYIDHTSEITEEDKIQIESTLIHLNIAKQAYEKTIKKD